MLEINEGCMAFLVDNPFPFSIGVHVGEKMQDGLWHCILISKIHHYQEVYLHTNQIARISDYDDLVIELYSKGVH